MNAPAEQEAYKYGYDGRMQNVFSDMGDLFSKVIPEGQRAFHRNWLSITAIRNGWNQANYDLAAEMS